MKPQAFVFAVTIVATAAACNPCPSPCEFEADPVLGQPSDVRRAGEQTADYAIGAVEDCGLGYVDASVTVEGLGHLPLRWVSTATAVDPSQYVESSAFAQRVSERMIEAGVPVHERGYGIDCNQAGASPYVSIDDWGHTDLALQVLAEQMAQQKVQGPFVVRIGEEIRYCADIACGI